MNKTYYQKLGLKESASAEEIKKACRNLSKKYHPDKDGGGEQCKTIFEEINEIYEILSDRGSRREYDIALKIKRERIKQYEESRAAYYKKKNNYERNYYRRNVKKPEEDKFSNSFSLLYRNTGPFGLIFMLLFMIGTISNAFEKPKNVQIVKPVNFDSIVFVNAEVKDAESYRRFIEK